MLKIERKVSNMKVISFCLWNNKPQYIVGALKNAELAKIFYPGWFVRFYMSSQENNIALQEQLMDIGEHVQIILVDQPPDWRLMLARFLPASDEEVDVFISRDTDSRPCLREKNAVDEWLHTDYVCHCMRDHPWHSVPMLGGLFGLKKGAVSNMTDLLNQWPAENRLQTDQEFLAQKIWPLVKEKTLSHDPYFSHLFGGKPFPDSRRAYEFCGATHDENDIVPKEQIRMLSNYWKP